MMKTATYSEFSLGVHQRFAETRIPIDVSIEVSRRCPLECQHCYNNLPMADVVARNRELSKEEYAAIFDELAAMGTMWILFTGGEIFARKDFLEIYMYAKQKGFLVTLFTNGTLINERTADYLREFPPFAVEITLYGRTRETYEQLTQVPGSYDRCLRGIRLLLERRLPLKLKTVGTKVNCHEVIGMKEFAEEELGVEFKFDSLINPRIDCSHSPIGVRLSPEEVVALDLHWPKVAAEYRANLEREARTPPPTSSKVYTCGGGMKSFAIDPYGLMTICVLSHQEGYDIRSGSVREGWEHFLMGLRRRERRAPSKCSACRIHSACSMCAANGELENGDAESPVEFLCEVAHLRAATLGMSIPEHGDCEFCNDAERVRALNESAERIRSRKIDPEAWSAQVPLLRVLNDASAVSTCGGCGSNSIH
jgi:radical SAM protein with 4Fe4S-binding SPASM domain